MEFKTLLVIALVVAACDCKINKQTEEAKDKLEAYIQETKLQVNPRYRLTYHISAPVGWINDPNGFSHYNNEYHLFYQYYPYDSKWGPMHWGHFTSNNLVHWSYRPTALLPDEEQCFSGSAVEQDGKMVLMYTGHTPTDKEPFFNESQYLAFSDDGINFEKYSGNPVLPTSPNGNADFRDPKVWKHEDHYYVILGSKTDDNRGRVLLYRSINLLDWEFLNVLAESDGRLGYMWECPDFFEIDGKYILLMSPQGITPEGDRYKNLHQTGYIVGNFNYDDFTFTPIQDFQELDFGHDFYAAQTQLFQNRRVLISWFGMWESDFPESVDGWAGAMTIVRELRLTNDNRLIQKPIPSMLLLRQQRAFTGIMEKEAGTAFNKAAELYVYGDDSEDIKIEFFGSEGGGNVTLKWDSTARKVSVDRIGDVRQVEWNPTGQVSFHVYLDTSSIEVFCGGGDVVFSTRVYPLGGWLMVNESNQPIKVRSYFLSKSIFS